MQKFRITEFAKLLGVSAQTLRNWDKTGKLTAHRHPSGHRYYLLEQADGVIKSNSGRKPFQENDTKYIELTDIQKLALKVLLGKDVELR